MIKFVSRLAKVSSLGTECILTDKLARLANLKSTNSRYLHITSMCLKTIRVAHEKIQVGTKFTVHRLDGENTVDLDNLTERFDIFPDERTPNRIFNGILYTELPIVNIKVTKNNTIMTLTDPKGTVLSIHSSGIEGFKNARKGTNVAAQQAALTFGNRIFEKGFKTIKIRVQGIGPGRSAAFKGLQSTGLSIVSITDDTRVSWNPPRARKQRRL